MGTPDADSDTIAHDTGSMVPEETSPGATSAVESGAADRPRRRIDVGLLIACCVIAGGLLLIIWGFSSALTGDDGVDRPDEIEDVSPVENAIQVLQQDAVVVDLQFGLDAVLVIDGIELETSRLGENDDDIEPGQQQTTDPSTAVYDAGNARITFRPADGAPIEEWTEGRHTATVIYWPIDEGREAGTSRYSWSFDVV